MGAQSFIVTGYGTTPREAFDELVEQALYDYGHAGYTGTIAEKSSFVMIPKDDRDPYAKAQDLLDADDARVSDKWGPAGCIRVGPAERWPGKYEYVFFGWASS